jgi:uncharacterized membrane protein
MSQRHYIAAATALGAALLWRGLRGSGLTAVLALIAGAELCARGAKGKSLWNLLTDDNIGGNQPNAQGPSAVLSNDFPGDRRADYP